MSPVTLTGIDVRPGKDTEINVELVPPTTERDDWVIRARFIAGGVASVLEERRKSSNVSDALGSEEISKSPDSSARLVEGTAPPSAGRLKT